MRATALTLVCLAALALGGCMSLVTGGPLVFNETDPTGVIVVSNQSNQTVSAVLISACRMSSYGLNRLSSGETIPPGYERTFVVSAGCWDVLAGNAGAEARQRMEVPPGGGVRYMVH